MFGLFQSFWLMQFLCFSFSRRGAGGSMNFSTTGRLSTSKRGDESTIQDESMEAEESKLE